MKPLFNQSEYNLAKTNDKLKCLCSTCNLPMYRTKRHIKEFYEGKRNIKFCSKRCKKISLSKSHYVNCKNCNLIFIKSNTYLKKTPNSFCSRSCAATYNNKHCKLHGTRRSKLEKYLQEQLTLLYPDLEIHYNRKDAINSELDVYIPSLKLAFELNGIFHYEPIFGSEKLSQIQNNDQRKFQACAEHGISLCIIDTSSLKYFKHSKCQKYLEIILQLINNISKNDITSI